MEGEVHLVQRMVVQIEPVQNASTTTKDGQSAYHSDSTRPLAISNTDNRLIASTFRLRWERLAAQHIHPHQRGFLPKRSMLSNVVEIDHRL